MSIQEGDTVLLQTISESDVLDWVVRQGFSDIGERAMKRGNAVLAQYDEPLGTILRINRKYSELVYRVEVSGRCIWVTGLHFVDSKKQLKLEVKI